MSLFAPLSLLFGLLAIPLVLFYMLKLRREDLEIPSTMLWQMVLQDRQANTPWQKLKRNLLLLLQLLILLAIVVALARPAIPGVGANSNQIIVVLDASASMQTVEGLENRFSIAQRELRELINSMPTSSAMTIILVNAQPQILTANSADKTELRGLINDLTVSNSEANWQAAFALANGAISQADHRILIISDGGISAEDTALFTDQIQLIPIGNQQENIGISAFNISTTPAGTELFIKVTNYGEASQSAILSILQDGVLVDAEVIEILPNTSATKLFSNLPDQSANYEALLSSPSNDTALDSFPLDDQAYLSHQPQTSGKVLLVSSGNFFLEQLLASIPELESYQLVVDETNETIALPSGEFAIYIFDGVLPETLPNGNLLILNPPSNAYFTVNEPITEISNLAVADHPLTSHIQWTDIQIKQTKSIPLPSWGIPLVNTSAGPLIFVGETGGRRLAVVGFDIHDTDLPLQITFPILFSNLFTYLNPTAMFNAPNGVQVGTPLKLNPNSAIESITITSPSGETYPLTPNEAGVTFTDTRTPGIYTISTSPETQTEAFAVNLFSAQESTIAPQTNLSISVSTPSGEIEPTTGFREIWPWFGLLALGVLVWEWWVYQRQHSTPQNWLTRFNFLRKKTQ